MGEMETHINKVNFNKPEGTVMFEELRCPEENLAG